MKNLREFFNFVFKFKNNFALKFTKNRDLNSLNFAKNSQRKSCEF